MEDPRILIPCPNPDMDNEPKVLVGLDEGRPFAGEVRGVCVETRCTACGE